MVKKIKIFLKKHSYLLHALVVMLAPLISENCKVLWYQPSEPEGLEDFVSENRLPKSDSV